MVSYSSGVNTPEVPEEYQINFIQVQLNKTTLLSGKSSENVVETARKGLIGNVTRDELFRAVEGNETEEDIVIIAQGYSMQQGNEIRLLDEFTGLNYVVSKERNYRKNTDLNVYECTRRKERGQV